MPAALAAHPGPPPRILDQARAMVEALAARTRPVEAALDAALASLASPRNRIAIMRSFTRIEHALAGEGELHVTTGRNHAALRLDLLRGGDLASARGAAGEPGASVRRVVVVAGKRGEALLSATTVEFGLYALARLMQRSGREDAASVSAALTEARGHADRLLPALVSPWLLPRLVGAGTPAVLPAGEGAFMCWFRIAQGGAARPCPSPIIEAATWLHRFELGEPARRLCGALLANAPLEALARGLRGLPRPLGGDRRAGSFRFWPLSDPPDVLDELTLQATPALVAGRLARGEADPDELVRELAVFHGPARP